MPSLPHFAVPLPVHVPPRQDVVLPDMVALLLPGEVVPAGVGRPHVGVHRADAGGEAV